jgi:peptidoglycan/xylan/chitin deacetylase (PgdA/CDA1 family)
MASLAEPAAAQANDHRRRWQAGHTVRAAVAGGVVLPCASLMGAPIHASLLVAVLASVVAFVAAAVVWRAGGHGMVAMAVAVPCLVLAGFLMGAQSYPGSGFVVALLLGTALGPVVPRPFPRRWSAIAGVLALACLLVLQRVAFGERGPEAAAGLLTLVAVVGLLLTLDEVADVREGAAFAGAGVSAVVVLYAGFSVFWVGSTAPTVTWFGALRSHGSRSGNEVALTFDDGPNPPYTLTIADILEAHGVRGTFFEVGKALAQRPDISKELIARGHIVANHSYNHGAFSYLDPRYPELAQTENVFRDEVGVCPTLFRPPHGTHTPFMSHVVTGQGMTLVTWDDSAQDWVETDPARLARNILANVKPGSIILLHDGIDGNIGADRSVVVQALPAILDGLAAKGLKPVTLDQLLGVPATRASC